MRMSPPWLREGCPPATTMTGEGIAKSKAPWSALTWDRQKDWDALRSCSGVGGPDLGTVGTIKTHYEP
jgi:hypothetical protein